MTQPLRFEATAYGAPVAGRVSLRVEIIAEIRRSAFDDELGAVVRGRLPSGQHALLIGPDIPQRQVGCVLHVAGYWDRQPGRGVVFRVHDLLGLERPHEVRATMLYLVANIAGLGRKRAHRIATVLGGDVLSRLIDDPTLARPLFRGGTAVAITHALAAWAAEQQRDTVSRQLTTRLTAAGVGYGTVRRIVRHFRGGDAAAIVTLRHPYRLLDVPRIGWPTADRIAQRLGVAENDPARLLAACKYTLDEAPAKGHTALPPAMLDARAARLLQRSAQCAPLQGATRLQEAGHATMVDTLVGIPDLVAVEAELADRVAGCLSAVRRLSADEELGIDAVLRASTLSAAQQTAVRNALQHGLSVLTGRPGAGKTTTIKTLVACAQALGWRVQIVAPTGKAASRAAAVAGVPASTVHRLLARESMDAPSPLTVDLLIVDESSMCDLEVATWLMRAVSTARGTRVVWCGDADQLPSVGCGQVLADLIASGVVPTARLTEVFRQAANSPIIRNAHRLLDSEPLDLTTTDGWTFEPLTGPVLHADTVVLQAVRALLDAGRTAADVQVLAPMRRGPLGVDHLNRQLQQLLNADGAIGPYVGGGTRVRAGDRVVSTRNMYDLPSPVYNGEQGVVLEADRRGTLVVHFGDRVVTLSGVQCLMLRMAWAMTVHRAQGSEYPAVVFAYDHRAHQPMLDRRLLYTGITRARDHLTLVGSLEAIAQTQQRVSRTRRYTTLAHHLSSLLPFVPVSR